MRSHASRATLSMQQAMGRSIQSHRCTLSRPGMLYASRWPTTRRMAKRSQRGLPDSSPRRSLASISGTPPPSMDDSSLMIHHSAVLLMPAQGSQVEWRTNSSWT